MTDDGSARFDTPEEFNEALTDLLTAAYEDDITVRGGWACATEGDHPDWDVVITTTREE